MHISNYAYTAKDSWLGAEANLSSIDATQNLSSYPDFRWRGTNAYDIAAVSKSFLSGRLISEPMNGVKKG
jgi:hypothetical protein